MQICDMCGTMDGTNSGIESVRLVRGCYDTVLREYDLCKKCRGELVDQIHNFVNLTGQPCYRRKCPKCGAALDRR